jgi:hypothetical protein
MEIDEILIWGSRLSLVFWIGILAWCGGSLYVKAKREREWLEQYKPTLESQINEKDVRSYVTLLELEQKKEQREAPRKRRQSESAAL